MKRFLQAITLASCSLLLAACGNLKNSDLASNSTTTTSKAKKYETTSSTDGGYSVLLKKGVYKTSPISGLEATNYDNSVDESAMERGLIRVSKKVFSTKDYVIQEGQQLELPMGQGYFPAIRKYPMGIQPCGAARVDAVRD